MSDNTYTPVPEVLKVVEAAKYLKVSKTLLYELIQKKADPFYPGERKKDSHKEARPGRVDGEKVLQMLT